MKASHWLVVIGLMVGCIAPDMNNPRRPPPQNPAEEILQPVEEILKFIFLGPQAPPDPRNANPERDNPNQRGNKQRADQAKAEAAKALNEAKEALDQAAAAAAKARLPEDKLADAAKPLDQAAAKLDEVAKQAGAAAEKAATPGEKQAARAAGENAAQAAQQARNLARMSKGQLPENLPRQIAQAAQELAEQDIPALKKMAAEAKADSAGSLEAARQALEKTRQAVAAAKGDKVKLAAAAQPLEQAAGKFGEVAKQAAIAAQEAKTPEAKQAAEAAQQSAARAAQQAQTLAAFAKGQLPGNLPGQIAQATRELASEKIPGIEKNAKAGKVNAGEALAAAKQALNAAASVATATANANPEGKLLEDAAKPLEQAAGKLDEAAKQAAQAARNATSHRGRQAAQAANRQAQSAAQQARNMARHAKGELPADSAKQIAESAKFMAEQGIPFAHEQAKAAKVDADELLQAAKSAFAQAAKLASEAAAKNEPHPLQASAPLAHAADRLDQVAKLAAGAIEKAQTPGEKNAAEDLLETAGKAAQHARNLAQQAKGELPHNLAGQIAKAAQDLAGQDLPGIKKTLNGQAPPNNGPGASGRKLVLLNDPFSLRKDPNARQDIINQLGGSQDTEDAVRRALEWFTRVQEADGHWDGVSGHESATTGLAMLAYMGYGAKHTWSLEEKNNLALTVKRLTEEPANPGLVGPRQPANPKGEINKPVKNAELTHYQKPLAKAVEWMLRIEKNGDLRGRRGDMYDHGIAAIALAEAYSLTKDPRLRQPLERVVAFTVKAQNPKTGGWRYRTYQENPRDKGDLSVTGWQLMALKSAKRGGLDVPDRVFERVQTFLNLTSVGRSGGDYRYFPGGPRNPSMVAEGMFCQQLLGPDRERIARAIQFMEQAAGQFTAVAKLAATVAENAETPEGKIAAELARKEAEAAAQTAREMVAKAEGMMPEKLPTKISNSARSLATKTIPQIIIQTEAAKVDANGTLAQARAILDRAGTTAESAVMDSSHPRMRESTRIVQGQLPSRNRANYYYWYYGSLAMHQNQGDPWKKWNQRLQPILLRNQVRTNRRNDGSWDPVGEWGFQAGRPVITALATLSLEVYYRYLPLNSLDWMKQEK